MFLRAVLAFALTLGVTAQADEVGLLQIHDKHKDGHKDHDFSTSFSNTRLQEQRRHLDHLVKILVDGDGPQDGAPRLLALVNSMVRKNAEGAEFIDVQPMMSFLMKSMRQGWLSSEELVDKEMDLMTKETAAIFGEMYSNNQRFINDIFLKESPATQTMDKTIGRTVEGVAAFASKALKQIVPKWKKIVQGTQLLLNVAEYGSVQMGLKPLGGAVKFLNNNALPAVANFDVVLDAGAKYAQMIRAKSGMNHEAELLLVKKASSMVVESTTQYRMDMLKTLDKLRAMYLKVLSDAQQDIMFHPEKYQMASSGMIFASGIGMASAAVDQAFDYFEEGFGECMQMFIDAWATGEKIPSPGEKIPSH